MPILKRLTEFTMVHSQIEYYEVVSKMFLKKEHPYKHEVTQDILINGKKQSPNKYTQYALCCERKKENTGSSEVIIHFWIEKHVMTFLMTQ